jgi:hypothetical protein
VNNLCGSRGCGTIFKMTPNGSGWTESVIYAFTGKGNGFDPFLHGLRCYRQSLRCSFLCRPRKLRTLFAEMGAAQCSNLRLAEKIGVSAFFIASSAAMGPTRLESSSTPAATSMAPPNAGAPLAAELSSSSCHNLTEIGRKPCSTVYRQDRWRFPAGPPSLRRGRKSLRRHQQRRNDVQRCCLRANSVINWHSGYDKSSRGR